MSSNEVPNSVVIHNLDVLSPEQYSTFVKNLGRMGLEVYSVAEHTFQAPQAVEPPEALPAQEAEEAGPRVTLEEMQEYAEILGYNKGLGSRAYNAFARMGWGTEYFKDDKIDLNWMKSLTIPEYDGDPTVIDQVPGLGRVSSWFIKEFVKSKIISVEQESEINTQISLW